MHRVIFWDIMEGLLEDIKPGWCLHGSGRQMGMSEYVEEEDMEGQTWLETGAWAEPSFIQAF